MLKDIKLYVFKYTATGFEFVAGVCVHIELYGFYM